MCRVALAGLLPLRLWCVLLPGCAAAAASAAARAHLSWGQGQTGPPRQPRNAWDVHGTAARVAFRARLRGNFVECRFESHTLVYKFT